MTPIRSIGADARRRLTSHDIIATSIVAAALATFAILSEPIAAADTVPRAGAVDPRVRTVAFRQNDVVAIEGRYGFLTMVELSEDERIENVAIGDSLAWQVVPSRSAHMLFLKPVEANAATNLAVINSWNNLCLT